MMVIFHLPINRFLAISIGSGISNEFRNVQSTSKNSRTNHTRTHTLTHLCSHSSFIARIWDANQFLKFVDGWNAHFRKPILQRINWSTHKHNLNVHFCRTSDRNTHVHSQSGAYCYFFNDSRESHTVSYTSICVFLDLVHSTMHESIHLFVKRQRK